MIIILHKSHNKCFSFLCIIIQTNNVSSLNNLDTAVSPLRIHTLLYLNNTFQLTSQNSEHESEYFNRSPLPEYGILLSSYLNFVEISSAFSLYGPEYWQCSTTEPAKHLAQLNIHEAVFMSNSKGKLEKRH